jgi:hypothetical protein
MAKSQRRTNKEIRKPKAAKGAAPPPTGLPLGAGVVSASPKKRK